MQNNYVVVGSGVSGSGVIEHLRSQNANLYLLDTSDKTFDGVTKIKKLDKSFAGYTAIVSPGISLHNKIYKKIKKFGLNPTSELELFGCELKGKQVAVTGTNGKTTTTMLIENMLKTSGKNAFSLGNIGSSIAHALENDSSENFYVVETSSFMLEKIKNYKPDVAVFLNFSPDHLNYHKNLAEYFNSKMQVFKNMGEDDLAVLNFDDNSVKEVSKKLNCPYLYFSTKYDLENGAYIKENNFYFCDELVCSVASTNLIGEHNLSNILAAICVAKYFGVTNEQIENSLKNFEQSPHRLQKIVSKGNLTFYNSSKATNIDSAITDINAVENPKIVLFGGSDKGENFKKLFENRLIGVDTIICYGKTANKIYKLALKFKNSTLKNVSIIKLKNLNEAINVAVQIAKNKNLVVMLAPACASFDEFKNYEERGDFFIKAIDKF